MRKRISILSSKFLDVLAHLSQVFPLLRTAAPRQVLLWLSLLLTQGLAPIATVYLTKILVDSFSLAFKGSRDWPEFRAALLWAGLLAAVMLLAEILRSLTNLVRATQAELLKDHVSALIQQKSTELDLAFYEAPEYYDHLHRARDQAAYRPVLLVDNLGSLLQGAITMAGMFAVLAPFGWLAPVALLAATAPSLLVILWYTLRQYEWQRQATPLQRRAYYYESVLTTGETAAEVRLFDLKDYFQAAWRQVRQKLRREQLHLARQQSLAELATSALALLLTGAALTWMAWQAFQGTVTLGALALFYQAFNQGQQVTRALLGNIGQLYANGLFLSDLFEFLALPPRIIDPEKSVAPPEARPPGICFEQVSFHYPGSQRLALRDFSLAIPAGQVVALVGLNGAGKTTVIKLLCRFYDPDAGRITLDGVDLRALKLSELRRLITVLFQQPVHYHATVAENISIGARQAEVQTAELQAAARAAGVDEIIERLPHGYENMLGKLFAGGAELSVGEWQRLALARAFWRRAPIILLDEPTSALDSWAENDWLRRFRKLAEGRTALIITHRFTTAMQADVIHVMADGRIIESGTHQELLAQGGFYAESWAAQMAAAETEQGA